MRAGPTQADPFCRLQPTGHSFGGPGPIPYGTLVHATRTCSVLLRVRLPWCQEPCGSVYCPSAPAAAAVAAAAAAALGVRSGRRGLVCWRGKLERLLRRAGRCFAGLVRCTLLPLPSVLGAASASTTSVVLLLGLLPSSWLQLQARGVCVCPCVSAPVVCSHAFVCARACEYLY